MKSRYLMVLICVFAGLSPHSWGKDSEWLVPVMGLILEDPEGDQNDQVPDQEGDEQSVCSQEHVDAIDGFRDMDGVALINMNPDFSTVSGVGACSYLSGEASAMDCIERRIKAVLPASCRSIVDVFVPGTNQEDGNPKQFMSLVDQQDNRAALSLSYLQIVGDPGLYDQGVINAKFGLELVLKTLVERFNVQQGRVYGHSKGSHPVAMVADQVLSDNDYNGFDFYAFGQAARTAVDIDSRASIKAAKLGTKGYIEKLSDNLIGVTWSNDEVRPYEGSGTNGLAIPPRWLYPGYIIDDSTGSINLLAAAYLRIDHHNTYGGDFVSETKPYCATGRGAFILTDNELKEYCSDRDVVFKPYFWGNSGCVDKAYEMMEEDDPDRHWIGASGPRAQECAPDETPIDVSYTLLYRYNRDDTQCKLNMEFKFHGLNGRPDGGSFKLTATKDTGLITAARKTGRVKMPINLRLEVRAWLTEQNTDNPIPFAPDFKCDKDITQTESYIDSLYISFTDPGTGESKYMAIIGNREGSDYPIGNITNKSRVAWKKVSGSWNMLYDTVYNAIKIEGETKKSAEGKFNKIVHLVD